MPVTKSAKGVLKQAIRRKAENLRVEKKFKEAIKTFRNNPTPANITKAYSAIDRAAKVHVIHKNKAARLKSGLSKLVKTTKVAKKKKGKAKKESVDTWNQAEALMFTAEKTLKDAGDKVAVS